METTSISHILCQVNLEPFVTDMSVVRMTVRIFSNAAAHHLSKLVQVKVAVLTRQLPTNTRRGNDPAMFTGPVRVQVRARPRTLA